MKGRLPADRGPEEGDARARVLLFSLGEERFAVALEPLEAILPAGPVAPIPLQPGFFEGFFELEGQCLPLLSLHRLLGVKESRGMGREPRIVVLRVGGVRLAIRVDEVLGTQEWEKMEEAKGEVPPCPLLDLDTLLRREGAGARP